MPAEGRRPTNGVVKVDTLAPLVHDRQAVACGSTLHPDASDRMDRRQSDLAQFLRSRRERLTPRDAGLPSGSRRKTPGLRREEVAELAGIGSGWYTFLEQGRDVRPSEGALLRIARALKLNRAEKKYLLSVALEAAPRCRAEEVVTPVVHFVATRALMSPAGILGHRWDLLEYNPAANAVFDFDFAPVHNMLRLYFIPEARVFLPNWEHAARQIVSEFRASNAKFLRDPWFKSLVDELKADSQEFSAWWAEQIVSEGYSGHLTCNHPFVGHLEFEYTSLQPRDSPNLTVRFFEPCDKGTRERVEELIRELQAGTRSSTHNLWTALRARLPL
jgi:transcriptional regulator with XRE-family HTH domain